LRKNRIGAGVYEKSRISHLFETDYSEIDVDVEELFLNHYEDIV
jgi:hypothetical protein